MGEAYFYHMTRSPLEETLQVLLGKAGQLFRRQVLVGYTAARFLCLESFLFLELDPDLLDILLGHVQILLQLLATNFFIASVILSI